MMEPKFWQDMDRTIPAQAGDKVAVAENVIFHGTTVPVTLTEARPERRPTLGMTDHPAKEGAQIWTLRTNETLTFNRVEFGNDPQQLWAKDAGHIVGPDGVMRPFKKIAYSGPTFHGNSLEDLIKLTNEGIAKIADQLPPTPTAQEVK